MRVFAIHSGWTGGALTAVGSGGLPTEVESVHGDAAGAADEAASSQLGTASSVGTDGRGSSSAVESDQGVPEATGAEARGRGSGAVVRGSGAGPDGAGGNTDPPSHLGELGAEGRGALGRGVGAAAPFFQVSDTEQSPHLNTASAGPATTSAGSGASQSGQAGASTKTSEA